MGHPLVAEFCRVAGTFSPAFLRRCQRVFRAEIQPLFDEVLALRAENEALRQQLTPKKKKGKAA